MLTDEDALGPYLGAWDELAGTCERPFCAPGWMLSWWRAAASGDARLRVVVALDEGDELIGVAPFFAQVAYGLAELRLLGAGFSHRIGPLATPGREEEVAAAIGPALAAMDPIPASVVFEGIDASDPWPRLIAEAWSRKGSRLMENASMEAPTIDLEGDYEGWMERRARKFRKEARRNARRLEEAGVEEATSCDDEAIEALLRLHNARWDDRGGSDIDGSAAEVLRLAAASLGDERRLEIVRLESPDGPIAAELLLYAGPVAAFWAGGFDPAWSRQAPGTQAMLVALRSAAERGVTLADLGGGDHDYKLRMADGTAPIVWVTMLPPGYRRLLILLRHAPKHLRHGLRRLSRMIPDPLRQRFQRR